MKMKKLLFTASLLATSLLFAGCQSTNDSENAAENEAKKEKLEIVTSFYPIYEFTKEIVGDEANVSMLIPASIEPHDWEPAAKDLELIQNADALVFNNENMETWIDEIQNTVDTTNLAIIDASEGIELLPFSEGAHEHDHSHEGEAHEHEHDHEGEVHEHDHDHEGEAHEHEGDTHDHEGEAHEPEADAHDHEAEGEAHEHEGHDHDEHGHHHEFDPHLWLSPKMAIKEVETIATELMKIDPENKEVYETNKNNYIQRLQELDKAYEEALANVTNKEIITQHAAFGYLADSYGLTQVPIAGLSPDNEPSAKQLKELKEFAEEHNISTIFFEDNASSKVAETLANELNAKTAVLNTLEGLSEEDEKNGATYISIMEENLKVLKDALK